MNDKNKSTPTSGNVGKKQDGQSHEEPSTSSNANSNANR